MPKFENGNTFGFKPGKSGNPAGRPKQKTFDEQMRDVLGETVVGPDGAEVTKSEIIARILTDKAIRERDLPTITLLAKRIWPEVNRHELSGSVGLEQQIADSAKELDRLLGINGETGEQVAGPSDSDHTVN